MTKQTFVITVESGSGVNSDLVEKAFKHICLSYGYLSFADACIAVEEQTKTSESCSCKCSDDYLSLEYFPHTQRERE